LSCDGTDTGFSGDEGTFTICSFWLVSALAMIGENEACPWPVPEGAVTRRTTSPLCRRDRCDDRPALGEFPQAFTHLSLIEAVSTLVALETEDSNLSA